MRSAGLALRCGSLFLVAAATLGAQYNPSAQYTEGALCRLDRPGGRPFADFPLKHTAVNAEISGMLARVTVVQEFQNSFSETVEAVYAFPLPHEAAVDKMTMLIGERLIQAEIKRRDEARNIYERARDSGQAASLLEQERPNIFTQSVANILPGDNIKIVISYVEVLKYEEGNYEFVFPMVVGPRYIPGRPIGREAGGWSPDTTRVPDASRITPLVTPRGTRAGHDVSIEVTLDAGLPIGYMGSKTHEIDLQRLGSNQALIKLRNQDVIPNKDFILRYDIAGQAIGAAVLAHRSSKDGFFTLIVQPPERIAAADVSPKELIFLLDTSGSMSGFPIEKAKEAMRMAIDGLYPQDTFNLITFSGFTEVLFPEPVPATPENLRIAQLFLQSRSGSGGTEMMRAIRTALEPSEQSGRVRIVCFMTDGLVGNDMDIIAEVQKHPEARVFAFGIGQSVNRFLLDEVAAQGRGEVEYVGLRDDGSAAARRFHERIRTPLLTNISIDWGSLPVSDVYPKQIPDLFASKPIIVTGRYTGPARGVARLRGYAGGGVSVRDVAMVLPGAQDKHDVLAPLWARKRIADLLSQDYNGAQRGAPFPDVQNQITQLGLDYKLMTQFTSFVAVEDRVLTPGGRPTRVEVPIDMPEGVSYRGVFGRGFGMMSGAYQPIRPGGVVGGALGSAGGMGGAAPPPPPARPMSGVGGGVAGGVLRGSPITVVPDRPAPPTQKLDPALVAKLQAADKTVKVEVQILLSDASPATMEQLRQLGFEVLRAPGRDLQATGRIAIEKLTELSQLQTVRYIVPHGRPL